MMVLILGACILLRVWDQGESVFRLHNVNIVGFYYLFNCATCSGHTTIFKHTYFPRTSENDLNTTNFMQIKPLSRSNCFDGLETIQDIASRILHGTTLFLKS
jgi:hypothetical protein